MTSFKILLLSVIVMFVSSHPQDYGSGIPKGGMPLMPYSFDYAVKDQNSGNDYGQKESSDGKSVKGIYYVMLPDTRIQTVKYNADSNSGFVADVQYQGKAVFPEPQNAHGYN